MDAQLRDEVKAKTRNAFRERPRRRRGSILSMYSGGRGGDQSELATVEERGFLGKATGGDQVMERSFIVKSSKWPLKGEMR